MTTESSPAWAGSADSWRNRNVHNVTCASGMQVTYRRVSLGWLITHGALPDELRELAVAEELAIEGRQPSAAVLLMAEELNKLGDEPTDEQRKAAHAAIDDVGAKLAALNREIVAASLISPRVTVEELADPAFPDDDLQMLADLNSGRRHVDAAGVVIGVAPLSVYETFPEEHGCAPDCESCTRSQQRHSTVDLGAV